MAGNVEPISEWSAMQAVVAAANPSTSTSNRAGRLRTPRVAEPGMDVAGNVDRRTIGKYGGRPSHAPAQRRDCPRRFPS